MGYTGQQPLIGGGPKLITVVPLQNVASSSALNTTWFTISSYAPTLCSVLIHGFVVRWVSGTVAAGTTTDTLVNVITANQTVTGANLPFTSYGPAFVTAGWARGTTIKDLFWYIPAVQANRWMYAYDSDTSGGSILATANTSPAWGSTMWLSSASSTRFFSVDAATVAASGKSMPRFTFSLRTGSVDGSATNAITGLAVDALASLYPPNKKAIGAQELAEQDALAGQLMLGYGIQDGGPTPYFTGFPTSM